jgi:hypothetical protein
LLFFWKLERFFVLIFWSSEVFNFFLIILGVFNFFVWSFHKQGNGVYAFLHMNFKIFLFSYIEIPESSIFFLSFGKFHMGEYCWGYCLKIWGFKNLFWWSSRIFNFVFKNFKGFPKLF